MCLIGIVNVIYDVLNVWIVLFYAFEVFYDDV